MRSAGGLDGNYADFSLDGVQVELVSGRGFSVLIMDQDGGVQSKHVYDTGYQADDSGPLATLLNGLPEGTPVLVATMDDASESLTSEAKASIETLGATKISSISYRDSYALIAIKGQSAIAEAHSPAGEGAIELKSKALWMPSCVDGSTTAQGGLISSTQAGTTLSTGLTVDGPGESSTSPASSSQIGWSFEFTDECFGYANALRNALALSLLSLLCMS